MAQPHIAAIDARPILDSRGDWTLEVRLELSNRKAVLASVAQGKSTGKHEAVSVAVPKACKLIKNLIAPNLNGIGPTRQRDIDLFLVGLDATRNKSRLGANAILGVSIACAKAAALAKNMPLWLYLRNLLGSQKNTRTPRLLVNLVNGGLHAGNNLDFQEYLAIPKTRNIPEAIDLSVKLYRALGEHLAHTKGKNAINVGDEGGFAPDFRDNGGPFQAIGEVARKLRIQNKVEFGLDAAASTLSLREEKLFDWYTHLCKKFPLVYIEDPFGEESFGQFAKLRQKLANTMLVAGDDLTTTNVKRMRKAQKYQSVNAVIIKPDQIGSVWETLDAVQKAREYGWAVFVSHRSGETNDTFIADLAFGVGAEGFKLGAPARGERIAKYNRLLEITVESERQ